MIHNKGISKITSFFLLLLLFFAMAKPNFANENADSLYAKFDKKKIDSTKAQLAFELGKHFMRKQPDTSVYFFKKAIGILNNYSAKERINTKDESKIEIQQINNYMYLGNAFSNMNQFDSSIANHKIGLEKAINLEHEMQTLDSPKCYELQIDCHNNLGITYFKSGDYSKALDSYQQSIKISKSIEDMHRLSQAILNTGMIKNKQGKYTEAIDNYYEALKVFEAEGDKKGIGICNLSIGSIYRKQEQYEKAIESYNKGLETFKETNDDYGIGACSNGLGITYWKLKDYTTAAEYLEKTLEIDIKYNNRRGVGRGYSNLALLYDSIQPQKAFEYLNKGLKIQEELKDYIAMIDSYTSLGVWYNNRYKLRKNKQDLTTAIAYANKGLFLSDSLGIPYKKKECLDALMRFYLSLNDIKGLNNSAREYIKIQDTLFSKEKTGIIADVEAKYETEKKEQQIETQKKELEQNQIRLKQERLIRNLFIGGFCIVLLLLFFIYRIFKQKKRTNLQLEEKNVLVLNQNEEILTQSEELKRFNDQLKQLSYFKEDMTRMVVHDLKAPLSTILNAKLIEDKAKRNDLIQQSGHRMMNLVQNILDVYKYENTEIKLKKDKTELLRLIDEAMEEVVSAVKDKSLSIEITEDVSYILNVDKDLTRRVFVNLFSNAIKFSPFNETITVNVKTIPQNKIRVAITNKGEGIPKDKQKFIFERFVQADKKTLGNTGSIGLGLTFCKMAVEAHNGEIGVVSEGDKGVEFWFTMPYVDTELNKQTNQEQQHAEAISLSIADKEFLSEYVDVLKEHKIYEVSAISEVLGNIDQKNNSITLWVKNIEDAVYMGNEDGYKKLLDFHL